MGALLPPPAPGDDSAEPAEAGTPCSAARPRQDSPCMEAHGVARGSTSSTPEAAAGVGVGTRNLPRLAGSMGHTRTAEGMGRRHGRSASH